APADRAIAAPDFRSPHLAFARETDRCVHRVLAEQANMLVGEAADLGRERMVAVPERWQREGTDGVYSSGRKLPRRICSSMSARLCAPAPPGAKSSAICRSQASASSN